MSKPSNKAPEGFWEWLRLDYWGTGVIDRILEESFDAACEKFNVEPFANCLTDDDLIDLADALSKYRWPWSKEGLRDCFRAAGLTTSKLGDGKRWPDEMTLIEQGLLVELYHTHRTMAEAYKDFATKMNPKPEEPRPGASVEHEDDDWFVKEVDEQLEFYLHPSGWVLGMPCYYPPRESAQAVLDAWRKEEVERAKNK